jgi:diaminohydroxyphosphoribosylaminopyrimidine deaminase/5-amino-6-(5-phosphoribosylamino)uracil reductase
MHLSKEQQHFFMCYCLKIAEKGRVSAPPNPWVGCVIINEGRIVGEGYHVAAGLPHAEIVALGAAGHLAKGATCFVSLEPCAHFGRTPPCIQALINAGISEVVIPFLDPDPLVSGKGVEALKKAGITVTVGVAEKEARSSLEPYLYQRKNKLPFVVLKAASSLDGRIAAQDGSSQWITGPLARENVHQVRAESQAILVGTNTALRDQPKLTARSPLVKKQPLRVVLDRTGKLSSPCPLLDVSLAPTLIFTSSESPQEQIKKWEAQGVEVETLPVHDGKLDLHALLSSLGKRGILQLMVEGGSILQSDFIEKKLAQRFILYIGAKILGKEGKPLFNLTPKSVQEAPAWHLLQVLHFDEDVRLDYAL